MALGSVLHRPDDHQAACQPAQQQQTQLLLKLLAEAHQMMLSVQRKRVDKEASTTQLANLKLKE